MPLSERIEPVKAGGVRTFLSAALANACIYVLNAVLGMRGANGIKVHMAEAGICVALDDKFKKDLDDLVDGGGGGGSISFRGEWTSGDTYSTNDVVIRSSVLNMQASESATFICLADGTTGGGNAPPTGETMSTAKWKTLARGHWKLIKCQNSGDGSTEIEAGKLTIELDEESPTPTRAIAEIADFPAWAIGSQVRFREARVCIDGVENKAMIWMSDPVPV